MKHAFFLAFLIFSFNGFCEDSIPNDLDTVKVHSVKKATILSAVLPGAGQIYNHLAMPKGKKKAFWKVPLIYAGLGSMSYFLITNQMEVNALKNEYSYREEFNTYNLDKYKNYDDDGILILYDQYARWRDFSIIGFIAVYALQVADAAVEAHFVSFDVSEDLSMRIEPTLLSYSTPGLRFSFNFR